MSYLALRRRNWIAGKDSIPIEPNNQVQRRRVRDEHDLRTIDLMLLILFST